MSKKKVLTWVILIFTDYNIDVEFSPTYTLAIKHAIMLKELGYNCKIYHEVLKDFESHD